MPTKLGDPDVQIDSPLSGESVMPDFSVTGSYSGWDGSSGQIVCRLQLGEASPLQVVATSAPGSPGATTGTFEAGFTAVPPGTYSLSFYLTTSPVPAVAYDITVLPYDECAFRLDQVSVNTSGATPTLTVVGTLPAGVATATLEPKCRATHMGARISDWTCDMAVTNGSWRITITVPTPRAQPYTYRVHASINVNGKRVCVSREIRYVVAAEIGPRRAPRA
ncbi:hypothetical protein [Frigoriglobus tundricola]|uniref:Uncharacterized protein n=1 Tax=Frigoriglobus tundricola TaxID=2774151 RepID=A0A6M5YWY5_9BACT|nr:hypothetical protein [Frigoriglobus tundricola]QJW98020.1 hypothetical protein FTUN_5600 [Frigoriglobus tundricola]